MVNEIFPPSDNRQKVGDIVEMIRDKDSDIAEYMERNFNLDDPICPQIYSIKESLDAMRTGTPFGIFVYTTLHVNKINLYSRGILSGL